MNLVGFPWPSIGERVPAWNGSHFLIDSERCEILTYSQSESAWSPELTALHEKEASTSHPIDIASRRLATESMKLVGTRRNPVVLDVGCSSGFLVQDLLREIPNAAVIGADYLPDVVLNAARRVRSAPFLQFDLRSCPLAGDCLDGVTALNVLEHIDDDFKALQEIQRILKPGGFAHIEVPADPASFDLYDEVLMHFRRYRLRDLKIKAREAGFAILKATHLGFFVYPLFKLVKRRNQKTGLHLNYHQKKEIVARQIGTTARTPILSGVFELERFLGSVFSYSCGIRAVLRLQKT
ncbi:MAG: class I SAM-dependent methyltransferase [Verrucomicrobia bacterium]|nr:class I SAM-dependent methyltransferase [Verrucomicrobiota bacterium]